METNKLSGIVVYTIHNNPTLRDALRNALVEKMEAEFLDESTYGVPIASKLRNQTKQNLIKICHDVEKETKSNYLEDDSVSLYWPTYKEESGDDRYIERVIIINGRIDH